MAAVDPEGIALAEKPRGPRRRKPAASSALLQAARDGNPVTVHGLVAALAEASADEQAEQHGQLPLHAAAGGGHATVVEVLAAAGLPVNARNRGKRAPLHEAVRGGHVAAVAALLAAGAECNIADAVKHTPLHFAAMFKRPDLVAPLVRAGAYVDAANVHLATPLHRAAEAGAVAVVEALLHAGADVDAQDSSLRTPLYVAVRDGRVSAARALLAGGANAAAADKTGATPQQCGEAAVLAAVFGVSPALGAEREVKKARPRPKPRPSLGKAGPARDARVAEIMLNLMMAIAVLLALIVGAFSLWHGHLGAPEPAVRKQVEAAEL
jgi:hypothetical protein